MSTGAGQTLGISAGTDCAPSTTYDSYAASTPIVFQQPTVYELLVWDTAGDGSGSGAGGIVNFDDTGTNTGGVVANTPSGSRLVSLVSTEQIATFKMTSSPWSGAIPLCVYLSQTVTAGPWPCLSMLTKTQVTSNLH